MGETNHKYPVFEVSILTVNHPDHDSERACIGDIISVRAPHHVIGTKEGKEFVWLRLEGPEQNSLQYLKHRVADYVDPDLKYMAERQYLKRYDKRRYCIPLERLKQLFPNFDIDRARDADDFYQPFITIDEADSGDYKYLAAEKPFRAEGLVFDKELGDYI